MSKNSTTARHRATPDRSIALQGLAVSAKSQARTLGRPALAVAAASGIAFGVGAPAHAGVTGPDSTETTNVQTSATVAAPAATATASGTVHTVVAGDTLGAISAAHGVSLNDVLSANGLSISTIIYPGDQFQIPAKLEIPFAAITAFVDPAVDFGLQFHAAVADVEPPVHEDAENDAPDTEHAGKQDVGTADDGSNVVTVDFGRKK